MRFLLSPLFLPSLMLLLSLLVSVTFLLDESNQKNQEAPDSLPLRQKGLRLFSHLANASCSMATVATANLNLRLVLPLSSSAPTASASPAPAGNQEEGKMGGGEINVVSTCVNCRFPPVFAKTA